MILNNIEYFITLGNYIQKLQDYVYNRFLIIYERVKLWK